MKEEYFEEMYEYLRKVPRAVCDRCFICYRTYGEIRANEKEDLFIVDEFAAELYEEEGEPLLQCMTYKLSKPICSFCYQRIKHYGFEKEVKTIIKEVQQSDEVKIWGNDIQIDQFYLPEDND